MAVSHLDVLRAVDSAFEVIQKPDHFTDFVHCEECAAHDVVLLRHDRSSLRPEHVNQPGGDPISFCSPLGKAYYLPSLVRFALEPGSEYWRQLLFHLEGDGPDNALITWCSPAQREAVALFLRHLLDTRASEVEQGHLADELLRTHEYWSRPAP